MSQIPVICSSATEKSPWTKILPGQRPPRPWTETPPDPGQRPPRPWTETLLDRDPPLLDRDPPGQKTPWTETLRGQTDTCEKHKLRLRAVKMFKAHCERAL